MMAKHLKLNNFEILRRAILLGVITVVSYVDQVHQILMVQLSHDAQLMLQCRNRGSLVLESLDGHEFMIRSLSQLNSTISRCLT